MKIPPIQSIIKITYEFFLCFSKIIKKYEYSQNSKLLLVIAITLLGVVFLFVSFFLVVIVFSDFLDLRNRRPTLTGNMILQYVYSNNEESLARIAESLESSEPQVRDSIVPFFIKNKAEQAASSLILKYYPLVAILCLYSEVMFFYVKEMVEIGI